MEADLDSPAVHTYLNMLQGVINRMAGNSGACKTWAVTLVSALLVLVLDKGKQSAALIAMLPVVAFFVLDSYYLALERGFRDTYTEFVADLHAGKPVGYRVFVISSVSGWKRALGVVRALYSVSTLPFYAVLAIGVLVAYRCILD